MRAVLFDVDGTLVDSNYLHIDAWSRALAEVGAPVESWRIHRSIGMDSGRMLRELLGDAADGLNDAAKDAHARLFRAQAGRLRAFGGAAELLGDLSDMGIAVVLATSAAADELELLISALGVDADRLITTNADDVDVAKPHPHIIEIALERAQVDASDAMFVGDTVWDMIAARRARVATIGVRSGGISSDELTSAGAMRLVDAVGRLSAAEFE